MKPPFLQTRIALFITTAFCLPLMASADESADNLPAETLETIVVSGTPFSQQVGTQKISEDKIKRRPSTNGNITELLKSNPNVKFANNTETSNTGGEIAPNEVSIHGEKFYNNNYTIDGISNNDNSFAAAEALSSSGTPVGNNPVDLPAGGTQAFWIDTSLLKNVEIFDSNISAKYGQFTGGVINAELKDPSLEKSSGRVYYRTTRDEWAEFHIQENQQENFEKANRGDRQPQFKKQQYGIVVSQPLSEKASLAFSYNRSESKIPLYHNYLDTWTNQTRVNETYLLRGVYLPDNGDLWKATVMYSPHKSKYFKQNVKEGAFTNTGGGIRLNLEWESNLSWAKVKSNVAYRKTGNEIEHESSEFNSYAKTQSFDWQSSVSSSNIGGYGTYRTQKETYTFKQDFEVIGFEIGSLEHKVNFGWQIDLANAKYKRDTEVKAYAWRADRNARNCTYCIEGEQFVRQITTYPVRDVKVQDSTYSAYIEDNMKWKNLMASFGMRLDYNAFLKNTDIAPRFSFSYDVFGDNKTQLVGGLNRYYSSSVISYKLRQGIGRNIVERRSSASSDFARVPETSSAARWAEYNVSDLKTPYSDEITLGLSQKVYNSRWTLKWVNRRGKEQFALKRATLPSGQTINSMTNEGSSKNDTFTLTISPIEKLKFKHVHIDWDLGANISKTRTNFTSYENSPLDSDIGMIILNGKLKDVSEIPATDFNSPWSSFIDINLTFPSINLEWDHRLSYRAGYRGYITKSGDCPSYNSVICGNYTGKVTEYNEYKQGSHFLLDWRFVYKQPIVREQYLELSLDVNNVLNRKIVASSNSSNTINTYKMGRNFWFGVSYNW